MNTVSIFGGTGFIGSAYCKQFPHILIQRDCLKAESDNILYLISTIDNYNVLDKPTIDVETNLIHLINVLEKNKSTLKCVNFVSSWFVYGDSEIPAKETSVCYPKGFYSITKKCAEDLLISYCKTNNINYRIFRLPNVYGKTDHKVSKKKNALQYLANKIKNNEPVELYYGGDFYRDYMHVDDVCKAINHLIIHGQNNSIYNIGTGNKIKFIDIINKIKQVTNSSSEIIPVQPSEFHKIVQVKDSLLDVSKLEQTGFKGATSILENLHTIL